MIQTTETPIFAEQIINEVKGNEYGAVVAFIGSVREHSEGKRVLYLEFEADRELVQRKLGQIADDIHQRWDSLKVAICQRMGRVAVGEIPLVVATAAPHRREAFEACQYAIDRVKELDPLWRKEVFQD